MATLLPSLSSDEEDNVLQNESDDEDDKADEVNHDFSYPFFVPSHHFESTDRFQGPVVHKISH